MPYPCMPPPSPVAYWCWWLYWMSRSTLSSAGGLFTMHYFLPNPFLHEMMRKQQDVASTFPFLSSPARNLSCGFPRPKQPGEQLHGTNIVLHGLGREGGWCCASFAWYTCDLHGLYDLPDLTWLNDGHVTVKRIFFVPVHSQLGEAKCVVSISSLYLWTCSVPFHPSEAWEEYREPFFSPSLDILFSSCWFSEPWGIEILSFGSMEALG